MYTTQDILKAACTTSTKTVLATIIQVEGSAYRKAGTMMLFKENGEQMGMISGGCLEEELMKQSLLLMQNPEKSAQKTMYDMHAEDDLGWGRGAGCNGILHILLEKVDSNLQKQLQTIHTQLDKGVTVRLVKHIHSTTSSSTNVNMEMTTVYTRILQNNEGILNGPSSKNKQTTTVHYNKKTQHYYFSQIIAPKSRIIIFGAGMDVHPLAKIADQTGFSVTIWDWRPALLKQSDFPNATLIHTNRLNSAIKHLHVAAGDFVVVMTHDFQKDKDILAHLLPIDGLGYLGILGPRRRTKRLIQGQVDYEAHLPIHTFPHHVHSPVGLSIGAEGPDEIAISILAEIILIKQGKCDEKGPSIEEAQYIRDLSSGGK